MYCNVLSSFCVWCFYHLTLFKVAGISWNIAKLRILYCDIFRCFNWKRVTNNAEEPRDASYYLEMFYTQHATKSRLVVALQTYYLSSFNFILNFCFVSQFDLEWLWITRTYTRIFTKTRIWNLWICPLVYIYNFVYLLLY